MLKAGTVAIRTRFPSLPLFSSLLCPPGPTLRTLLTAQMRAHPRLLPRFGLLSIRGLGASLGPLRPQAVSALASGLCCRGLPLSSPPPGRFRRSGGSSHPLLRVKLGFLTHPTARRRRGEQAGTAPRFPAPGGPRQSSPGGPAPQFQELVLGGPSWRLTRVEGPGSRGVSGLQKGRASSLPPFRGPCGCGTRWCGVPTGALTAGGCAALSYDSASLEFGLPPVG